MVWLEYWDDDAQAYYYYNLLTDIAVWEKPDDYDEAAAAGYWSGGWEDGSQNVADLEWAEFWDENAQSYYYYNYSTEEATWVKPDTYVAANGEWQGGETGTWEGYYDEWGNWVDTSEL